MALLYHKTAAGVAWAREGKQCASPVRVPISPADGLKGGSAEDLTDLTRPYTDGDIPGSDGHPYGGGGEAEKRVVRSK
jgi:hypothetical protein